MRRRIKDTVDLMKQSREFRFREGLKALDDTAEGNNCRFCGCEIEDEGPWHDLECPMHTAFLDEEDDSDFPVAEYEEQTKGEDP